jgi:hypothetical protein
MEKPASISYFLSNISVLEKHTLPCATTLYNTTHGANCWSQEDIDTLLLSLLAHEVSAATGELRVEAEWC